MCGIAGIFDTRGRREIDRELLVRMCDALAHRGPDGAGLHIDPGLGLGHRRLSIIDLDAGGQPLYNEDGSVVVTYNGEIYNFRELTETLVGRGHKFRTRCDTEVLVHAWEEWGEACVERLRGMFAFALWDSNQETLFLARDRLGIKPLYYTILPDGRAAFASELKALLLIPELSREFDPTAIEDYFAYGYVPDPKSIYKGVFKLAPGHVLTLRRARPIPAPRQYWDVEFDESHARPESEVVDELISRLKEAVGIQMIADVSLGAFLSGGVDSSAVVSQMAGHSNDPPITCSISFDSQAFDESHYAAMVAERYATRHHVHRVNFDAVELTDRLARIYDEPYADSSAIPTFVLCRLARQHVKVALSGDGGDEVFAGYRRYRSGHYQDVVRRWIPRSIRKPLFGALARAYPSMDLAPWQLRLKPHFLAVSRDPVAAYFGGISLVKDPVRASLLSGDLKQALQGYHAIEPLNDHMSRAASGSYLARLQYADLKTYLCGDILTKVDRASMANSLEVRVPMLDHEFVEWAARLPLAQKLNRWEGKYILKKAIEPYVPNEILYRRKQGFAVPLREWFSGPLREHVQALSTASALADTGLFEMKFAGKLIDEFRSGHRDHSATIWSLMMFDAFLRRVHTATSDDSAATSANGVMAVRGMPSTRVNSGGSPSEGRAAEPMQADDFDPNRSRAP